MQLVDRIEKRRYVGREFLLWLWFESELFDATLATREHGPFGLWIERQLVLSAGKESTRIKGSLPGLGREAKEALLRGQLPESAGVRIAQGESETSFVFKAEHMAVSGLKLQTVLDKGDDEPNKLLEELLPQRGPKSKKPKQVDASHEAFYERMRMTQEFEGLLEALYRDFLALRLSELWRQRVVPLMQTWAAGGELDAEAYRALKSPRKRSQAS